MAMRKLSVTIDEELARQIQARAGKRGVSAFVNQAVSHELERGDLSDLLAELEEELGPPDEDMVNETLELLRKLDRRALKRSRPR